ncbi:MAG TPA: methyltransferase domain-containing protein [Blastocatellia bacterium]|nr:methyltransferase domain-containing protein [Blastocatellia bacterium]
MIKGMAKRVMPDAVRRWLWHRHHLWPLPGWVRFGSLRRVTPICRDFGFSRGQPVLRYYIENFLAAHAGDVRGHVLELGDDSYTVRFGGGRVTGSDVLHVETGHAGVTIVADLTAAPQIANETFDCVIFTEALHFIYDFRAALETLYRILKPGGVLLATFPGVSLQICRAEADRWGDYWRFTTYSARRLFEEVFPPPNVHVEAHGNVLAAVASLHGLAAGELRREELDYHDRDYEVLIVVRAVKQEQ